MNKILELYNKINQFGNLLGMEFELIEPGVIHYHLDITKEHLATIDVVHGGVIAAFMDGILGVACLAVSSQKNELVATIEFKINYVKPAQLGDRLLGIGKVEHQGKSIMISSGEVVNKENNELIAKGMGTFKAYPIEKTGLDKKI